MQSVTTLNHTTYNSVEQNNDDKLAIEYIIPKCPFEKYLETRSGLKQHINLLQNLYDEGTAFNWQNSFKTDICLLPKMLLRIREKYRDIKLIILEFGIEQLEIEVTKLIDNKIKSAKLIFGFDGLAMESNHFIMADYYFDDSLTSNNISIIFFNAGSSSSDIKKLLTRSKAVNSLKDNLQVKFCFVSLGIQKSNVDCLFFSLELAKATHKSMIEIQKFHLLNINDKLTLGFAPEQQREIIATKNSSYKFDRYIPCSMMKHCQSRQRIDSYIRLRKICGISTKVVLNKKQETLESRYGLNNNNSKSFSGKITRIFSIEAARLATLKKIEYNWDEITKMSLQVKGNIYNSI